ncbi:vWA domain-containing protein [Nioella nitratireducens]|uniref:vWA domain-containing protein n=1 Tax=Nioella nitratireducens TaxID=1287720 RepID=UPI001F1B94DA|nr:tellurium resistance protein TerY [Nioella nitratireducens]
MYLLIDRSASMRGEPIASVNNAVRVLLGALRQDPYALETAHMSVLGYAREVTEIVPLTPIDMIQVPEITVPRSGPPHLGLALETLAGRVPGELRRGTADRKGDWSPSLILMTRGRVADPHLFVAQTRHLRTLGFSQIIGCLTGPNGTGEDIGLLCDHVVALDTMDSAGFSSLFRWVSSSIATVGRQAPGAPLPVPPREIRLDL